VNIDQIVRRATYTDDAFAILNAEPDTPTVSPFLNAENSHVLARICNKALLNHNWPISVRLGAACASYACIESVAFLTSFVMKAQGSMISHPYQLPYPLVHLSVLTLVCLLTSIKLFPSTETIREAFLERFFSLQQDLLQGVGTPGHVHPTVFVPRPNSPDDILDPATPYVLIMKWFHFSGDLDFGRHLRSLAAFLLGQCCIPPTMAPPLRGVSDDTKALVAIAMDHDTSTQSQIYPNVTVCTTPPPEMFDVLAAEISKEDSFLRCERTKQNTGPLWSTLLLNQIYALAAMVPFYPKGAAHSPSVRGATLSQLIKVQTILATGLQAKDLYDDEEDGKLFLYVRATSALRIALQCVTSSWLSTGFGSRFAISEEGGRDLVQFCIRHIMQTYDKKAALTKVLGTPWERLMMNQGPTKLLCDLFVDICSSEGNLIEVARINNADKALHSLARFGENDIRQTATGLLTKVALILGKVKPKEEVPV